MVEESVESVIEISFIYCGIVFLFSSSGNGVEKGVE